MLTSGITLIALVVTIVVLLILAGITITYVMGDNSIFNKAQEAKEQSKIESLREKIELIKADWWMDKQIDQNIGIDDLWDKLIAGNVITSKNDVKGPEKEGDNNIYTLDTTDGYVVEIIEKPDFLKLKKNKTKKKKKYKKKK